MEDEYEKIKREIEISGRAEQKRYMDEYTAGLSNIEEDLRTPEMCIEAVKNNEGAMKSVPKKMRETIKIEVDKHKKELVEKILNQQEIIANQQVKINKLNS